jgi:nucleoside-diphosphate-sugar epimerase
MQPWSDRKEDRRIVVTGAKGNVGDAVLRQLLDAGESVRAVTRKPEEANLPDGAKADSPVPHAPTPSCFRGGTVVALLSHPGSAR